MKPEEFAQLIRTKYPNGVASDGTLYTDMDDQELTRRVVEKYPVYKKQVQIDGGLIGSPIGAVKEFATGVAGSLKERGGEVVEELRKIRSGERVGQPIDRSVVRIAGAGAGAVSDIGFETIKLLAPKFVEDFVSKAGEKVAETEVVQAFAEKYTELQEKHPEAMKDIENIIDIAALIPIGKGAQTGVKTAEKGIQKVSKVTGEAIEATRMARIARAGEEIDDIVGKIVQGKKKDISKAKKALSYLDTSDVKTYADLRTKLDDGIEALAKKVDDTLEVSGNEVGLLKSRQLQTVTEVGKTKVKQNFVNDAIKQLDELYTKIKDAQNKARIGELKTKLSKEGLTLKELNDLAREYNTAFSNKGFSKTGEALTSINAQAFENTRKGIKNVVRSKIPDDVTKMLDQRMSEMLNTRRLVAKMEERVNSLYQRVKKRGVMENIARKTAGVVDAATFGTVSGFISRMLPSNVGLKVMNSIDLEKALTKRLAKFNKLLKVTNDEALTDGIVEILKETSR